MALLNADKYKSLAGVSAGSSSRKPGKFFSVFLCGEPRDKQKIGTYQCMKSFDSGEYFINNAENVFFAPLYIKRYWAKYQEQTDQKGNKYQKLVDFGWDETVPKSEGAKFEYIIAGYLFDPDKKEFVKHTADIPDAEISAGDNIMVFFRCAGVKCGSAVDLLNRIAEKCKGLPALCNDAAVEKNVIAPRRFIVKAATTSRKTNFGNRLVFDFFPEIQLSENVIEKLLDASEKYLKDFEYQFNKSEQVKSGSSSEGEALIDHSSTTVDIDEVPSVQSSDNASGEFEIAL